MADGAFPKNHREALHYIMWGTVVFCTFLVGIEKLADGNLLVAKNFFIAFIVEVFLMLTFSRIRKEPYFYFKAKITDSGKISAFMPIYVANDFPTTFSNVTWWLSRGEAKRNPLLNISPDPYRELQQIPMSPIILHSGSFLTNTSLPLGDYCFECNANLGDNTVGFVEYMELREHEGKVIQLIDVWKHIKTVQNSNGKSREIFELIFSSPKKRPQQFLRIHNPNQEQYVP